MSMTTQNLRTGINSPAIHRSVLLTLLMLCCLSCCLYAQEETLIFDLDNGTFNKERLPYINTLRITGLPIREGKTVDAIELTVLQLFTQNKGKLKALRSDLVDERKKKREITQKQTALTKIQAAHNRKKNAPNRVASKVKRDSILTALKALDFKFKEKEVEDSTKLGNWLTEKLTSLRDDFIESTNAIIRMQADSVNLEAASSSGKAVFYKELWTRSATAKEFSFSLGKRLAMGEDYTFEFKTYVLNKDPFPVDRLRIRIVNRIDSIVGKTGYYDLKVLKKDVEDAVRYFERDQFSLAFTLNEKGKGLSRGFTLSGEKIEDLTKNLAVYAVHKQGMYEDSVQIIAEKAAIDTILRKKINGTITPRFNKLPGDTLKKLNDFLDLPPHEYDSAKLGTFLRRQHYRADSVRDIKTHMEARNRLILHKQASVKPAENARVAIEKAFDFVKTAFLAEGNVSSTGRTSGSGQTDIEGDVYSTTYGIATVWLADNYFEWFRFLGINFRLAGFDNRLPGKEAFEHQFWSRISLMAGISASSDMYYRGQKLLDTRLGFKPVLGINIKPHKQIDVGIGTISFMPGTPDNTRRTAKFRGYASISFDFNLINYLIQKK
jgi:hypothetical protein